MTQRITWSHPAPHQVFQRDSHNMASVEFTVQIAGVSGRVEVRTASTPWKGYGELEGYGGSITGKLEQLPTGEHKLYVRIVNEEEGAVIAQSELGPIFIGDLWLLAGQSNMEGCGRLIDVEPPQSGVSCFYLGDRWDLAVEPLNWPLESEDPVHWKNWLANGGKRDDLMKALRRDRVLGSGLGVAFGKTILAQTGVPIGLIMTASGGTSMSEWDPGLKGMEGQSLYGAMLRSVQAAGGKLKGMLWYQGESDATEEAVPKYAERMKQFVSCLRQDLGDARLPFIYVQLGPVYTQLGLELEWPAEKTWNRIQHDQLLLEQELGDAILVPAIDMRLDDFIHLATDSLIKLGRRMASCALSQVYQITTTELGPRLSSVSWSADRTKLTLSFTGLNGRFQAAERLLGFTLMSDGIPITHTARLTEEGKEIMLSLEEAAPAACNLYHGKGMNPVVNTRDQLGYPLPVWGPVPV